MNSAPSLRRNVAGSSSIPRRRKIGRSMGSNDSPMWKRGKVSFSRTSTSWPAWASRFAVVLPAGPPPTTMTSRRVEEGELEFEGVFEGLDEAMGPSNRLPEQQGGVDASEREVVVHHDVQPLDLHRLAHHVAQRGAARVGLVEVERGRDEALVGHRQAERRFE